MTGPFSLALGFNSSSKLIVPTGTINDPRAGYTTLFITDPRPGYEGRYVTNPQGYPA